MCECEGAINYNSQWYHNNHNNQTIRSSSHTRAAQSENVLLVMTTTTYLVLVWLSSPKVGVALLHHLHQGADYREPSAFSDGFAKNAVECISPVRGVRGTCECLR